MILILTGRSGCGKNAVAEWLISHYGYEMVKTCTTRKRRDGEPEDAYYFMTEDEFKAGIMEGRFAEFDIYVRNYYGTLRSSLEQCEKALIIATPDGAYHIKKVFPETFVVHIATDMKTAVLRAISREEKLDPGILKRISDRATQDNALFAQPDCNFTLDNPEGMSLYSAAERIAAAHENWAVDHLMKGTNRMLKEMRTDLEEYEEKQHE